MDEIIITRNFTNPEKTTCPNPNDELIDNVCYSECDLDNMEIDNSNKKFCKIKNSINKNTAGNTSIPFNCVNEGHNVIDNKCYLPCGSNFQIYGEVTGQKEDLKKCFNGEIKEQKMREIISPIEICPTNSININNKCYQLDNNGNDLCYPNDSANLYGGQESCIVNKLNKLERLEFSFDEYKLIDPINGVCPDSRLLDPITNKCLCSKTKGYTKPDSNYTDARHPGKIGACFRPPQNRVNLSSIGKKCPDNSIPRSGGGCNPFCDNIEKTHYEKRWITELPATCDIYNLTDRPFREIKNSDICDANSSPYQGICYYNCPIDFKTDPTDFKKCIPTAPSSTRLRINKIPNFECGKDLELINGVCYNKCAPEINNGILVKSENNKCFYKCNTGFKKNNEGKCEKDCANVNPKDLNGSWQLETNSLDKCILVCNNDFQNIDNKCISKCEEKVFQNGKYKLNSSKLGCDIECNTGYKLENNKCIIDCNNLTNYPNDLNGKWQYDNILDKCILVCNNSFKLENGICIKDCNSLPNIPNGLYELNNNKTICNVKCNAGFEFVNNECKQIATPVKTIVSKTPSKPVAKTTAKKTVAKKTTTKIPTKSKKVIK